MRGLSVLVPIGIGITAAAMIGKKMNSKNMKKYSRKMRRAFM